MEHEQGLAVGRMLVGRQASGLNCWQMSKHVLLMLITVQLLYEPDVTQGHNTMLKSAARIGGKTRGGGDEGGNSPAALGSK